ncbi:MAG: metallophosphoesterase [Ruminococcus sp.]|nr:metallophosphoesterase [Ruminococcus sp.]MDE7099555.1 metallophosphoesterase [Ruminococcus sp.]
MIYYCMSDIHGCLSAFNEALDMVLDKLDEPDTAIILLGDYIHGGEDNYGVLDRIISLQRKYGSDKVIALLGNHDEIVCDGIFTIDGHGWGNDERDDRYINWLSRLPRYHIDGKTIFVHAGIDEEYGECWEYCTEDYIFTEKYPAQTGYFFKDYKIVAGHCGTAEIAGNPRFHGIYYDGESHYYIDSTVLNSGFLNVLKVDTENQKYYEVTPDAEIPVEPYEY